MTKSLINPLTFLALLHDIAVAAFVWFAAYLLRFNFAIPPEHLQYMLQSIVWVAPMQGAVFVVYGLYRGMWRFASVSDLKRILFAVSSATVLVAALLFMMRTSIVIPRSVLISCMERALALWNCTIIR